MLDGGRGERWGGRVARGRLFVRSRGVRLAWLGEDEGRRIGRASVRSNRRVIRRREGDARSSRRVPLVVCRLERSPDPRLLHLHRPFTELEHTLSLLPARQRTRSKRVGLNRLLLLHRHRETPIRAPRLPPSTLIPNPILVLQRHMPRSTITSHSLDSRPPPERPQSPLRLRLLSPQYDTLLHNNLLLQIMQMSLIVARLLFQGDPLCSRCCCC